MQYSICRFLWVKWFDLSRLIVTVFCIEFLHFIRTTNFPKFVYCALAISAGPDLVRVRTSENGINLSSPDKDGFKCHSKQLPSVLTSKTDDSDDDDDGGHQQHQQRESNFVCLCQSGRMINHAWGHSDATTMQECVVRYYRIWWWTRPMILETGPRLMGFWIPHISRQISTTMLFTALKATTKQSLTERKSY